MRMDGARIYNAYWIFCIKVKFFQQSSKKIQPWFFFSSTELFPKETGDGPKFKWEDKFR